MRSTSEHFQIVKSSQDKAISPNTKIQKKPFFKSSPGHVKSKILFSDNLLRLKQLIDTNNIEYTLTVCVFLTFINKGKTSLSKTEIIESIKKEIINNPNKIYIFKGGAKEKVDLFNIERRINILLLRSQFVNIISGSKGYAFYACMKKHNFGPRKT